MKWNHQLPPEEGATRTTKAWAFIPTKVFSIPDKRYCWIWLETYYTLEVYKHDWASWAGSTTWKIEKRFIK